MPNKVTIKFANNEFKIGNNEKLALIAGPCVIESKDIVFECAEKLVEICDKLNINFIFKSSFDKANRSSKDSFRGPGLAKGLEILNEIKNKFQIPVISDVHECYQINEVKDVLNVLQIPAFLARQTDLLIAAANSGLPVNVKKGQFMAPKDMQNVIDKMENEKNFNGLMLCERGTSFGYGNLIVDMRGLAIMAETNYPIIYDATHSVQLPAAQGNCSGGDRKFIPHLTKAAVAVGINGLFMETHPNPDKALCDGPNQWPLNKMEVFLKDILKIYELSKNNIY